MIKSWEPGSNLAIDATIFHPLPLQIAVVEALADQEDMTPCVNGTESSSDHLLLTPSAALVGSSLSVQPLGSE